MDKSDSLAPHEVANSANLPDISRVPEVRGSLNHKRFSKVDGRFCSDMLDFALPVAAEQVKTKTVGLGLYQFDQALLERRPLSRIDGALKYGVLYTLPVVETSFGDPSQSRLPRIVDRAHIVTD